MAQSEKVKPRQEPLWIVDVKKRIKPCLYKNYGISLGKSIPMYVSVSVHGKMSCSLSNEIQPGIQYPIPQSHFSLKHLVYPVAA
jgi:hypothetical protein